MSNWTDDPRKRRTAVAHQAMCPYCGKQVAVTVAQVSMACTSCGMPGTVLLDSWEQAVAVEWTLPAEEGEE